MDGFNCLKATEPLLRDSLLFTTEPPGVRGTHLIDLEKVKCCRIAKCKII